MPSPKSTTTKKASASADSKAAPRKAAPRKDKAAAPSAASAKAAKDAPPAPPKKDAPTVDLLTPKKKVRKPVSESARTRATLPSIIPEKKKAHKPEKDVAAPAAPAPPPPVSAEGTPPVPAEAPTLEPRTLLLKAPISVKDLAPLLGIKPHQVIKSLMDLHIFANINLTLELDTVAKVCEKHGFVLEREKKDPTKGYRKPEVHVEPPKEPEPPEEEALKLRPPVVTFMGHVDHGKTSLLDHIRKARVARGEAGGITQHIGAYSVERPTGSITFLDTPGHAVFTAMRARGAMATDIVVLVVAADDGLMPQTLEAINHAKAANVPIIVAINKIDLPSANPDKVKTQLQEKGLVAEDWGGQTICCLVSATKGTGMDHLLDMIALQAEVLEIKADPKSAARCIVIESQIEQGRGPTATVIVRMGTLKAGDAFICGNYHGKIKQLINDLGKPVKQAGPGTPVKVLGFSGLPVAGDELVVMDNERVARLLSEERLEALRSDKLATPQRATLENLFTSIEDDLKKSLDIVLKTDVHGSVEAIVGALKDFPQNKVALEIIHSAVGPITESDVLLASASNAIILGFGTKVENTASVSAKREGVQIKLYSIIYELLDQVKEAMEGLLAPELRESVIGRAEVRQVFDLSRGKVAGCYVTEGRILRTARARVVRKRQPIYDGGVATLRRFKDEVKEVRSGLECGIRLGDFSEYLPEDIIECYTLEKIPQQL